jgi:hypothetical protein
MTTLCAAIRQRECTVGANRMVLSVRSESKGYTLTAYRSEKHAAQGHENAQKLVRQL